MLLWLWCRPAAVAASQPLACELLYATDSALKSKKKKKKEKKKESVITRTMECDDCYWGQLMM